MPPLPLSPAELIAKTWHFGRPGRPADCTDMKLLPDGRVGNYHRPNEQRWLIDADGYLCLADASGKITTRFDMAVREGNTLRFEGRHLLRDDIDIRLSLESVDLPPGFLPNWTQTAFKTQMSRAGWRIGEYSYGAPQVLEQGMARLHVGRFCSFAQNIVVALGNHRMDMTSTFPFAALKSAWPGVPDVPDHVTRGDVEIGNDVWLGTRVFITSGVRIGDGAVIGAESVVTRDVPPYAIVAGNPARVLRYRFDADTIVRLQALSWWDWDYDRVNAWLPYIMSADITAFLELAERQKYPPITADFFR